MDKIELIKQAIEDAKNNKSKLTPDLLDLSGFTSHKIKHLLNNLGAISEKYFEIGLHKASTFICTLYGNDVKGIGVDNWSQFEQDGLSKKIAYEKTAQCLSKEQYVIWERDCFSISELELRNVDMYNYDGEHGYENQKKGITYFYPMMADEFILCVDDTSWEAPRKGTEDGIKEMNLEILFEEHLWDGKESGEWHNGFSVYLLKKRK